MYVKEKQGNERKQNVGKRNINDATIISENNTLIMLRWMCRRWECMHGKVYQTVPNALYALLGRTSASLSL